MKSSWLFLLLNLVIAKVWAVQYSLSPIYRQFPENKTIEASVKEEWLLWSKKENPQDWKFGFIQPKIVVGAHAMIEGQINLYPVSFVELGYAQSKTSRFYDITTFNCDQVLCRGNVNRERLSFKIGVPIQFSKVLYTYSRAKLHSEDTSKPVADETEHLLAYPGDDTLTVQSFTVGRDFTLDTFMGFMNRTAYYQDSMKGNNAYYFVYKTKWNGAFINLAAGQYVSSYSDAGFSMFGSVTWKWGDSISLF
jgi:hypothetical protein